MIRKILYGSSFVVPLIVIGVLSFIINKSIKEKTDLEVASESEINSIKLALEAQKIQEAASQLSAKTAYEAEIAKINAVLKATEAKALADTTQAIKAKEEAEAAAAKAVLAAKAVIEAKTAQEAADALKAVADTKALMDIEATKLALEANPPKDAVFATLIGVEGGSIQFSYVGELEESRVTTTVQILKGIPFVINQKIPVGIRTVQIIPDATAKFAIKNDRLSLYGINIIPTCVYGSVTSSSDTTARMRLVYKDAVVSGFSPLLVKSKMMTTFFIDTNGKAVDKVQTYTSTVSVNMTKIAIGTNDLLPSKLSNTMVLQGGKLSVIASATTEDKRGMIPNLPGDDGNNQARIDNVLVGKYIWGGAGYIISV